MFGNKIYLLSLLFLAIYSQAIGQAQQGLLYKAGTDIRLGGVQILNKRSLNSAKSNIYGAFSIPALAGDTLEISCASYNGVELIVSDFADKILFLKPAIALSEVVIKETSVLTDLNEAKRGYKKKSVFYTGTPHYYYLVLKPMTFIYENFKSEVKNARKFNRFAKNEQAYYEVTARFNDYTIKSAIPIRDEELEDFKSDYWPSVAQMRKWNDYDLSNYIIKSYKDFINGIYPKTP